ncbi:hypothetical protein PBY51_013925 [Eleginops maclovinus]|uniref:Uncharacterized protein n=1 Tax=Eleginops maclovinus TaxID=56733 RepID=A0AAN7WY24_ELEMC|nr:hypothetical protein PBY51_013925 [Eleginops maclovinus]
MQMEMKASRKHNNSITPHSLPLLRSVGARVEPCGVTDVQRSQCRGSLTHDADQSSPSVGGASSMYSD